MILPFHELSNISAVVLMGQAGSSGGDALADVLSGKVSPCGHLAATWAKEYEDYPNADTFGYRNGNRDDEYYTEGIYVGYRWFDSFGKVPAYSFGYGKSYTTFSVETKDILLKNSEIVLNVQVTNTGKEYSGREVVQIYISEPDGRLEKPYQELAAYAKTKCLQPGESENMTISFPVSRMASYDETGSVDLGERAAIFSV
ncbi:MAG: glycoside hydrolase family 3 C-terminal domain-containing protein [Blautia faecis]